MPLRFLDKKEEKEKWNQFVDDSPQGSVFCYIEWLEFSTEENYEVLLYEENGKIIAGMPLPFFYDKKIRLPPLTQKMGVLYSPEIYKLKTCTRIGKEKEILYSFIDFFLPKVKSFSMNFDWHFTNWQPFYWRGFTQTTRYTYVIDYEGKKLEDIWSGFDSKTTRNAIKVAQKHDIAVSFTDDIYDLVDLQNKVFERKKLRFKVDAYYIEKMYSAMRSYSLILKGTDNTGKTHAAILIVFDKKSAYCILAGSDPELRKSQAQTLLEFEAIKYFYGKVKYFDFEGTMIEEVEPHFRGFGAEQKTYFFIKKFSLLKDLVFATREHLQNKKFIRNMKSLINSFNLKNR